MPQLSDSTVDLILAAGIILTNVSLLLQGRRITLLRRELSRRKSLPWMSLN